MRLPSLVVLLFSSDWQRCVQQEKRFPDGAVLVEWGKSTGDDVWFLNKLEELAAKLACAPKKSDNDSMVWCLDSINSTLLLETEHRVSSSCYGGVRTIVL
jgi:hypothetical protein